MPPGKVSINPVAAADKPEDYIGQAADMVSENQTTVTITNRTNKSSKSVYVKSELAKLEGCKVDERCWAVGVSLKSFPRNLVFCNHKGKLGHGPLGRMHQFKPGFSAKVQRAPFRKP